MWAFHKLKRFVEYSSEERAAFVDTVHPGNTSQRCNGNVRDDNRHQNEFEYPAM
jgi:transposase